MEGKAIAIADACSRYPTADNSKIFGCLRIIASIEEVINAVEIDNKMRSLSPDMGNVQSVTIERIKSATSEDECIQKLIKYISCGFPSAKDEIPPDVQPFWNVRNELTNVRDLVLHGTRIVVPSSLRSEILEVLHSA